VTMTPADVRRRLDALAAQPPLPRRTTGPARAALAQQIAVLYDAGAGIPQLQVALGRSPAFILRLLVEGGARIRPRGAAPQIAWAPPPTRTINALSQHRPRTRRPAKEYT
jgi:hypothetical protein